MARSKEESELAPIISESKSTDSGSVAKPNNKSCWERTVIGLTVIISVITSCIFVISMPVSARRFVRNGADVYVQALLLPLWSTVITFPLFLLHVVKGSFDIRAVSPKTLILPGVMNSLSGVLYTYACVPSRTPAYLQGILLSSLVPYTVLIRLVLLKKGINKKCLLCVLAVFLGIGIAMVPRVWLPGGHVNTAPEVQPLSLTARIIWPFIFGLNFIPMSIVYVLVEKAEREQQISVFPLLFFNQLVTTLCTILMFWTDLIPHVGMAGNIDGIITHLHNGFRCHLGFDSQCSGVVLPTWLAIGGYCFNYMFVFMLIYYSEGAVFGQLVQSLSLPISTLFWTLFTDEHYFHWDPVFNTSTIFIILGLLILIPAVMAYDYFAAKEASEEVEEYHQLEETQKPK